MKTLSVMILTIFVAGCLGCKLSSILSSSEFSNASDHFSITFPGGSGDVETQYGKAKNKYISTPGTVYSKDLDNRSNNYRSYEVTAFSLKADPPNDAPSEKAILSFGLNGWDKEPETVTKEMTINGLHALDSVRTVEMGEAKMTFREIVFWSNKEKLLYVLRIAATKKENVTTQEADDFIKSFRML